MQQGKIDNLSVTTFLNSENWFLYLNNINFIFIAVLLLFIAVF